MGFYENRVFPWLIERLEGPELFVMRERVVRGAEGDVLEIGFGTGKTLPYYDANRVGSVTAVEPSEGMTRKARERIAASPLPVKTVPLAGEQLPFDDASFDSCVVTMTLCSVTDQQQVLSEMFRVLRPGARYHFLEHVASEKPKVRAWQDRLNGLNRIVGCGCNLNRDTAAAIAGAGFTIEQIERRVSKDMPMNPEMYPVILGVATKP